MSELVKLWAGRVFGTNTGNFFLEFEDSADESLSGTFRLMDTFLGLAVCRLSGTFDGSKLLLRGEAAKAQGPPGVNLGTIDIVGSLTSEGNLRGTWSSSIGTAGTFEAFPHEQATASLQATGSQLPEQVYVSSVAVGAVRIFREDLWQLIDFCKRDFIAARPIVTYAIRGNEVSKYLDDFAKESGDLGRLGRFKLTVQEPEAHGINKMVILDFNAFGRNEVRVQGINESWVTGKSEATSRILRQSENKLVTTYKRFGLTLNQLVFASMLIFIPAITRLWQRAIFVASVFCLLVTLLWLHQKFIPNAAVFLSDKNPNFIERAWPTILSWLIAATAGLAGTLVFRWLTK